MEFEQEESEERKLMSRHVNTESTAFNTTYFNTERYVTTLR